MSPDALPDIADLERGLGYTFKDRDLLMKALTHKSFHFEKPQHSIGYNERLEFLGDSVLGLAVAGELFTMAEKYDESMMSKVKSYVVKGEVISEVAHGLMLGDYLRLGKGENESGGRTKPSLLANATEAIIGAVYIEAGYAEARELVLRLFGERLTEAIASDIYKDFKSELQEISQEEFAMLPEYRVAEEEGPEHEKVFNVEVLIKGEVYGVGSGSRKKDAQQAAAREALKRLSGA